jgi:hypothetical protein
LKAVNVSYATIETSNSRSLADHGRNVMAIRRLVPEALGAKARLVNGGLTRR